MNPLLDTSGSSFSLRNEDVLEALRHWHELTYIEPKLAGLYSVRRLVYEKQRLLHHAINEFVGSGLTLLAQSNAQEAEMLTLRFREQIPVGEVAERYNVSISRFHTLQRDAVKYLTVTLNHLDETAWQQQKHSLLFRLDATTNRELVGVEDQVTQLLALLDPANKHTVVAIEGIGGIGKTSLADATARSAIERRLFDEVAWITARQERLNDGGVIVTHPRSTLSAMELIEGLAEQLIPQSLHEYTLSPDRLLALLNRQLKQWPHLVVIDNLETVLDLETLLPTLNALANPSKFLLTSRIAHYASGTIFHFRVPELSLPNALTFIRHEIVNRNLTALASWNDEQLKGITTITGGNPLAIRLFVGQTHILDMELLLRHLKDVGSSPTDNLFDYIYRHSWERLPDEGRRLLLSMPLINPDGDDISMLIAINDLSPVFVEQALAQLVNLSLVDVTGDGNNHEYRIHGLTRTFLREKILAAAAEVAQAEMYQHYFVESLARGLKFVLQQISDEEHHPLFGTPVRNRAINLLSHALAHPGLWPLTVELLRALIPKMERVGQRDYWIPYLEKAVERSREQEDTLTEAALALAIGELYRLRSNYEVGRRWLDQSIRQFNQASDHEGLARARNQLAYLAWRQHHYAETIELATQALGLVGEASLERAMSLSALGLVALDRWQWAEAEAYHRQALEIRVNHHSQRQVAWSLQNLACALRGQQRYDEAIHYYEEAIDLLENVQDPLNGAVAKMNLGIVFSLQGKSDAAIAVYNAAEQVIHEIGDTFNLAKVNVNKGIEYLALQEWVQAADAFTVSSNLFHSLDDFSEYLNAIDGLGLAYLGQERFAEAEAIFAKVLEGVAQMDPNSAFYQVLHPDKIKAQLSAAQQGHTG